MAHKKELQYKNPGTAISTSMQQAIRDNMSKNGSIFKRIGDIPGGLGRKEVFLQEIAFFRMIS